jgi:hypothetical protein
MTVQCESAPCLPRAVFSKVAGPRRGADPFDFILTKISPAGGSHLSAAMAAQNRSLT